MCNVLTCSLSVCRGISNIRFVLQVPYEKLVKVFTLLQYNIKDGYRLTPLQASVSLQLFNFY